ncbi:transglycosylase SLT domain-containing protein [Streptomyces iconiensis]|uniref:Transglycosylase SLT domain-containing protein n=1 Tax=Streptomyces iconiensis TaxID=1384038 RepID=A0ABT6ZSU9_9ACTN|nr:transglycosylase SLT domain-containing protein [Streptomyces iconiensis]MDJ1132142.1 transglycosylase SLT domain-containing protein [Streptomyces iconiensis]
MPSNTGFTLSTKAKKYSSIGLGTAGAAALALTVLPGTAAHGDSDQAIAKKTSTQSAAYSMDSSTLPKQGQELTTLPGGKKPDAKDDAKDAKGADAKDEKKTEAAAEPQDAKEAKEAKQAKAAKEAQDAKDRAAQAAKQERAKKEAASRSAKRAPAQPAYPDNLDGWIRESLAVMKQHGIPGSYEGIKRNVIRESGGNPRAINNWDVNAVNGVPSKGLLQVIKPTFDAYHVEGTPADQYDPVANIVAACNYAADRYGSMDNVNSAY